MIFRMADLGEPFVWSRSVGKLKIKKIWFTKFFFTFLKFRVGRSAKKKKEREREREREKERKPDKKTMPSGITQVAYQEIC